MWVSGRVLEPERTRSRSTCAGMAFRRATLCSSEKSGVSRILIIEDDLSLATALSEGLQYEGYTTLVARDGAAGLRLAGQREVDVILLDIVLPEVNGIEVCRRLRSRGSAVPIVMLTSRSRELDKVVGLKAGADDYLTKPFSFMELLARVEAVLRRSQRFAEQTHTHAFGGVTLNFRTREATKLGQALALLPREFCLLEYFVEHRGEVVSREQLLDSVWGHDAISPLTRTVDMHIAKLRQKIEDNPSDPRWLVTVHRVGYKFTG